MTLDDLALATRSLASAAFHERYPAPALLFLTSFERPRDVAAVLSALTPEAGTPLKALDGVPFDPSETVAGEAPAVEGGDVKRSSLVLFVKKRAGEAQGAVVVGRAAVVDYCLPSPTVSRVHASFRPEADGWVLVDEGGTNGTYVDGKRVPATASVKLSDGMRISFGPDVQAKFYSSAALYGLLRLLRAGVLG